jgi:molybdopterin-guanine dinucleotide biosynthesis protein A
MGRVAGILPAGGRSSRMGTPIAHLEWHVATLLRRTAGVVAALNGDRIASNPQAPPAGGDRVLFGGPAGYDTARMGRRKDTGT